MNCMKKIIIIAVVLLAAVAFGVYDTFLKKPVTENLSGGALKGSLPELSKSEAFAAALKPIAQDSSDADKLRQIAAVRLLATKAPEITIDRCAVSPLVYLAKQGAEVIVKNIGTSSTDIKFGKAGSYNILPGKSVSLTARSSVKGNTVDLVACGGVPVGLVYAPKE